VRVCKCVCERVGLCARVHVRVCLRVSVCVCEECMHMLVYVHAFGQSCLFVTCSLLM